MHGLTPIGRILFAIALVGLGIEHFLFEEFITGRAPAWPQGIPGGLVWAYVSGVAIIMTGAAILTGKKARSAGILAGILIFIWAFLRHIPVIAGDSFLAGTWTKAGKALTFFGGIYAIAGTLPRLENSRDTSLMKFMNLSDEFIVLGRICLGLFLVLAGVQHFLYAEFVASLIPGWFPGNAVFWAYFAGVALIAGGVGLFIPQTARLAALFSGLMVFSWFWIIHIPRALTSVSDGIAVFEALAVSGIAFAIAGFSDGAHSQGRGD
ncbi:MAG TPA: hypothetical protein VGX68_06475 [Thermoanaerobaculia bacterium]|jgi:uncharacterized membrane protein|nr:hypothetical protein [Thermoanaerobaculia bacterium]